MMFTEIRDQFFPFKIGDYEVRAVSAETVYTVTDQLIHQIFTPFSQLGLYQMPPDRLVRQKSLRQALNRHSEHFLFYDNENNPIGWSIGTQHDADTFFMSWTGILPVHQRHGLYTRFLTQLLRYLEAIGYERVTSNHMVNNRAVLIAKLKAGFHITGLTLDERWGAQVGMAYYFSAERYAGFRQAFSLETYSQI